MPKLLLPVAVACATVAGAGASSSPIAPAVAAPEHRAVVVVDTGQEVRRVCVRFTEDFLTGQELLIRANTDPVFRQYAGLGAAVCALCGVGCPPDESCLTCGGDTYWTYSRAPKGSSEFRVSGAGASSTKVHDGDVEGWRWSKGLLPAYASVDQVCGPAPGGTTTTTGAAASPTTAAPTTTTTASSRRTTTTTVEASRVAGAGDGPTTTTASTSATPAAPSTTTTDRVAAPPTVPSGDDAGGGSPWSLVAFAVVLGGLLGWAVWLRRVRGSERPPPPAP